MLENEIAPTDAAPEEGGGDPAPTPPAKTLATTMSRTTRRTHDSRPAQPAEDISYHAVEKDGQVTAIWEMQGRKHIRTIDPRSRQGQDILRLYTTEHHDETAAAEASEAASS